MGDSSSSSDVKLDTVSLDYAEIIVIRHGETPWNADGRIQGHLDVELNDMGKQQAAAVAERLSREPKFSIVYSSDLKRAAQTAEMIANSCGGLEVIKDPGLRERHLGDLQGLVSSEVAKVNPKAYQAYVSHRRDQEIPPPTCDGQQPTVRAQIWNEWRLGHSPATGNGSRQGLLSLLQKNLDCPFFARRTLIEYHHLHKIQYLPFITASTEPVPPLHGTSTTASTRKSDPSFSNCFYFVADSSAEPNGLDHHGTTAIEEWGSRVRVMLW